MKGKLLAFLIPVVYVFALLLVASPHQVRAIVLPGICEPISCGTTQGTKQEPVYGEVCEKGCPTVEFRASRQVCPIGYPNVSHKHKGYCYKNGGNIDYPEDYKLMITEYYGPTYHVLYEKSSDPNKCHRPSDNTLKDFYGMSNNDVRLQFKDLNSEWKASENINCTEEIIRYDTVSCNNATVIACAQDCPTECGYEGGSVADGDGGLKTCPATNSCSTYRWCYPEEESPTGYLAQAVSVSIPTPAIGKPWESGKMIDQYCGYTPAGKCPTTCGYAGGEIVPDGQGGTLTCPATAACPGDDDEEEEDDDGEIEGVTDEDEGEVKGTTDVVLAETGASDTTLVYFVQMILVLGTLVSSAIFVKKYML